MIELSKVPRILVIDKGAKNPAGKLLEEGPRNFVQGLYGQDGFASLDRGFLIKCEGEYGNVSFHSVLIHF